MQVTDGTQCFPTTFCPFLGCSLTLTKDGDVDTVKFFVAFPICFDPVVSS